MPPAPAGEGRPSALDRLPLGTRGFALVNVALAGCRLWVGSLVVREYRRLSAAQAAAKAA